MERVKISDVAKRAGVSKSTISNYLNGRYELMSAETRKRIAQAVEELHYTPNISARRLSAKLHSNAICLVIPLNIARTFETFYYPTVLSTVGKEAGSKEYNLLIYARGGMDHAREIEYLVGMAGTITDGFLLFDINDDDKYFKAFEKQNIPYVCVGKIEGYEEYNYVATDHKRAMVDAVEHLVQLGHKKIAYINEGVSVVTGARRMGVEEALCKHGIPLEKRYAGMVRKHTSPNSEENYEICKRLLLQPDPPTAIISPSCAVLGIERVCEENHINVPEDLSVIIMDYNKGYNFRHTGYTHFPSIADKVSDIAFHKLYDYIQNREEEITSMLIPVHLVPGNSTTHPSAGGRVSFQEKGGLTSQE